MYINNMVNEEQTNQGETMTHYSTVFNKEDGLACSVYYNTGHKKPFQVVFSDTDCGEVIANLFYSTESGALQKAKNLVNGNP